MGPLVLVVMKRSKNLSNFVLTIKICKHNLFVIQMRLVENVVKSVGLNYENESSYFSPTGVTTENGNAERKKSNEIQRKYILDFFKRFLVIFVIFRFCKARQ